MKYYLIKITAKSTSENPNFHDETIISYSGKGEFNFNTYSDGSFLRHEIVEYGYKTLSAAKKGFKKAEEVYGYFNRTNNYWNYTIELVETEVR